MIPVEVTNIDAKKFVTPSSRYSDSKVLLYGEQGIITFETYKKKNFAPSTNDKFTVIPAGEEYRPDKTSYRAYGTVDFWWAIMEVNNIKDVFDYTAGTNIRIPAFITVFGGA